MCEFRPLKETAASSSLKIVMPHEKKVFSETMPANSNEVYQASCDSYIRCLNEEFEDEKDKNFIRNYKYALYK